MRKQHVLCALTAVIFFACTADRDDLIRDTSHCKITTGYYYGGSGVMNDSALFTYDNNGRIVKLEDSYGVYTYTYAGNNISVRKYADKFSSDIFATDSINYNSSNQVTEMRTHDYMGWSGSDTSFTRTIFEYSSNRLSRIVTVYTEYSVFGTYTDSMQFIYTWNAAGNIEKVSNLDMSGYLIDEIVYQYDGNTNFFSVVHPHFFLFDPMFQLHVGIEAHLPYFYSKNNVSGYNLYGSFEPVTYQLDSTNKVTGVDVTGSEYVKYKYKCN